MKSTLLSLCLSAAISLAAQQSQSQAAPQSQPKTMTRVGVTLQSPDAPAGSFAAAPKVFYRAGTRYCRMEEWPDPEHGVQQQLIVNEPDYWMVNLLSRTGRHGVDPGPTFNCHQPIFPGTPRQLNDEDREVMKLEFGMEMEFFQTHGATPQKGPVLQGKETTVYKAKVVNSELALFTGGTPERPLAVSRHSGQSNDLFSYSGYEQLPFDAKLFSKPENVKIEDARP